MMAMRDRLEIRPATDEELLRAGVNRLGEPIDGGLQGVRDGEHVLGDGDISVVVQADRHRSGLVYVLPRPSKHRGLVGRVQKLLHIVPNHGVLLVVPRGDNPDV